MKKEGKKFIWAIALLNIFIIYSQEKITHEKKVYVSPEGKAEAAGSTLEYSINKNDDLKELAKKAVEIERNPMYLDTEGYNTFRSPSCVDTITKKVIYPIQDVIYEIYADSKPPVTKRSFNGSKIFKKDNKEFIKGQTSLELEANDEMSGVNKIYYSIDGSPFKEYTNPLDLNQAKEYSIKYYAIDNVGNDEEVNSLVLVVDNAKPVTKLEVDGDRHENIVSGTSKLVLKSEDNQGVKGIYYAIDGAPVKKYTYPIQTKYYREGDHKMIYYAIDDVENVEDTVTFEFYIDKTPPTIVQEILGNSIIANGQEYSSGRSKLKLTTFDNKAGIKEIFYSINNGEYQKYEQPFYLSAVSGKLSVKAYALDNVNNRSTENQEMSKNTLPYIDLSGPQVSYKFSGPVFYTRDTIYINSDTKILLAANDAEAGLNKISFSLDGGSIGDYSQSFSIEGEGMHKISFTAYDNVDNTNTSEFSVFVDNKGPEVFSRYSTQRVKEGDTVKIYPSYVVLFLSATDMVVGFDKMTYKINNEGSIKNYDGYINGFARDKDYAITVKAYDKLGNKTENVVNFKTDTF